MNWRIAKVSADGTHHVVDAEPLYQARFDEVLAFHEPGLAAVRQGDEGWHIACDGTPAYERRFSRTFGFYEELAAVAVEEGWRHIRPDGSDAYESRFAWCGNFLEQRCPVRAFDGRYRHIKPDGEPAYLSTWAYAGDYKDDTAVVQGDDGLSTHIDTDGRLVHGQWFLDLDVFHKGFARARDQLGWTHVDREGIPIYQRRFAAVEPFYNGQARMEDFDGSLLVVDEAGHEVARLRGPLRSELEQLSGDLVGFWRTQTIRAAVDVGLFEALPGTAADLDWRLGLAGSSFRLMRALSELRLADEDGDGVWHLTVRGTLLKADHELSMADAARLWGSEHYAAWQHLTDALRSGQPAFEGIEGEAFFGWLASRRSDLGAYHRAMSSYARHDYRTLGQVVDFSRHHTLLDVGGGHGELLFSLLLETPHLEGLLIDRPEVVREVCMPAELSPRCRILAGDFFAPWPVRADAVVLARVLHDWPDEQALAILKRAREALDGNGRLYVVEMLLGERAPSGAMLDLNMLVITGGRERTLGEFEDLFKETSLHLVERRDLKSVSSVLIAEPL